MWGRRVAQFGSSKAFLHGTRLERAPQAVAANRHQTRLRRGKLDHVKRFLVFLRDPLRSSAVKLSSRLISPQRKRRDAEAGKKPAVNSKLRIEFAIHYSPFSISASM